jgi:hypothetical protein
MSAIAVAPDRSAPRPRAHGTNRERGVLRLVRSTRAPLRRNSSHARLIETWNRVLDATEQALNAAEATNVLAGPELLRRRQHLTEERRWLVRLKEIGPYDPLPRLRDPQPALDRDRPESPSDR